MTIVDISCRAGDAKAILEEPIEHLQQSWQRGEFFEYRILEYIYWHYKGGIFVDVGSAIGNHSLFFAKFCQPKYVISIEPVQRSVIRQWKLFELNGVVDKIIMQNCALSDRVGRGHMEAFASHNLGQYRLRPGNDSNGYVDVTTLDAVLSQAGILGSKERVTLIKADVEGHELRVLYGAEETLRQKRPALFLEIRSRSAHKAITEHLATLGYKQVGSAFQGDAIHEFTVC